METHKSGSSREAIKAAERLGYFTVLLTDQRKLFRQRNEFPDIHQMAEIDVNNQDAIRDFVGGLQRQGKQVEAVVSFVDPHVSSASLLDRELCGGRLSAEAISRMEDKVETRKALEGTEFSPRFAIWDPEKRKSMEDNPLGIYPVMVKSPLSTGSKEVILAKSSYEYSMALQTLLKANPQQPLLIEDYVDGEQFLVETVVANGKVHMIAIIHQEITYFSRFIITGYNLMISPPKEFRNKLRNAVESIVQKLGMKCGACHLELRHSPQGKWKLIEINPRISGGAMNNIIKSAYGIDLVEETLKLITGGTPSLQPKYEKHTFTQYVVLSESGNLVKVTGKHRAMSAPGVQEVYIKPRRGAHLTPPVSMGQRYAYVIAAGESEEKARENAQYAAGQIRFHLRPY